MNELAGPKILLEGPSGTGKTYALGTLADWAEANGMKMSVLFTENGLETLLGYWADKNKPIPSGLSWKVLNTKPLSLAALMDGADKVGKLSYDSITKLQDPTRSQNNAFYGILSACNDFVDDRTGSKLGAIDSWDNTHIFALDSLSELANAAMKMVIGNKPTASQPDYMLAQNNLMNFLRLATQGLKCTFVLTAHVDRLTDEVMGGTRIMTKALGKAISGDIPQLFSDVIYCVRDGSVWTWDTAAANVDVKTRNLPVAAKIVPDFATIMNKWNARRIAK